MDTSKQETWAAFADFTTSVRAAILYDKIHDFVGLGQWLLLCHMRPLGSLFLPLAQIRSVHQSTPRVVSATSTAKVAIHTQNIF
jgi:hypothetical protein